MSNEIKTRDQIKDSDKWNLSALYSNIEEWEKDFERFKSLVPGVSDFKGTLSKSPENLKACLDYMMELEQLEERLGYYSFLKVTEDVGDSKRQELQARFTQTATECSAASSYQVPEIQSIENPQEFLKAEVLQDYSIYLSKLFRYKPHILSEAEEKLLAMQMESNETPSKAFGSLVDVDLDFGTIKTPEGDVQVSQSSYGSLMIHEDREVRESAYKTFYKGFDSVKNTLANLYIGSVQQDVYKAKIRNFKSARQSKLFSDDVPESVYDNLIASVHNNFDKLHRYYEIRRKAMKLDKLRMFDTKVPLSNDVKVLHTYDQAVEVIMDALKPMGEEYCATLKAGLTGNWVDRYENKGKRSGAFSAGSYKGEPYILMNFKEDNLRDVFTLAHEAGHSMHSWYSVKSNPFQHYNYTIFEAEVASTFNEELLFRHMLKVTEDPEVRKYLINKKIDDLIATLFRQTMFAEFEHIAHNEIEEGRPLSLARLREIYKELLQAYFGSSMDLGELDDLEGLRIPHFYRSFYVYKYATGIAAATSLAEGVLSGDKDALENYFKFLKSGGSRFPIESLKMAGVDMSGQEAVNKAMDYFETLINELENMLL